MLRLGIGTLLKNCKKSAAVKQISSVNQDEFKAVYKLPYIRGIGVINRLKFFQTVATSTALPTAAILSQIGTLSIDSITLTGIAALTMLIPLYGLGYFANKLIGFVYVNEKNDLVKFAYLDFWGKRKDVVIPLKEIVPFSETSRSVTDPLYFKVRQYSSKETLKLCTKYGILDGTGFNKIFLQ